MESDKLVRFGDRWVKVRDNVYYLSKYEVEVLEIWYTHEDEMSEEERADAIELFAKALQLLNPRDGSETSRFVARLEYLYKYASTAIRDVINRIYSNVMRKVEEGET